jgi:hypothetical protein
MSNNTTLEKIKNTSITYKEVAFNFFMPIGKLSGNSTTRKEFVKNGNIRIVKTPFGTMEIRNRLLTENDQKLINAIFHFGDIRILEDGNIASYFSEAEIMRELSMGNNYTTLRKNVKKIGDTQYYIPVGKFTRRISIFKEHVIDEQEGSKMQGVVFDPEYIKMHKSDFSVNYRSIFPKISSIPHATIPSIIKYLLMKKKTSDIKEFHLIKILEDLGFPLDSPSSLREVKYNLKNYADTLERDYNIIYNHSKKTLVYGGLEEISYIERVECSMEDLKSYIGKRIKYEKSNNIIQEITQKENSNDEWIIITDKEEINLNCLLDDLLFLLDKTTTLQNNIEIN